MEPSKIRTEGYIVGSQKEGKGRYRRSVKDIAQHLKPKELFELITCRSRTYSWYFQEEFGLRDKALLAAYVCTAGRASEVVPGPRFRWLGRTSHPNEVMIGKHKGILCGDVSMDDNYLTIGNMEVSKRSQKLLDKLGAGIAMRSEIILPLKRGLYDTPFRDQLVPFVWLIKRYYDLYRPWKKTLPLFGVQTSAAYKIVRGVTGLHPHHFRSAAETFYGTYCMRDMVELSQFVGVVDPRSVKDYMKFNPAAHLKDATAIMDFDWIDPAVEQIKTWNPKRRRGALYIPPIPSMSESNQPQPSPVLQSPSIESVQQDKDSTLPQQDI